MQWGRVLFSRGKVNPAARGRGKTGKISQHRNLFLIHGVTSTCASTCTSIFGDRSVRTEELHGEAIVRAGRNYIARTLLANGVAKVDPLSRTTS